MRTWGEARADAVRALRGGADPATASLDADVLLAFALRTSKEDLAAHPERAMSADAEAAFGSLVARRVKGEPVAYLRGWKDFYGHSFRVDPRVLIPRPETETLVDEARRAIAGRGVTVADVGTGSGAIAISIALAEPNVRVIATDASDGALQVAAANALVHGVIDRVDFRQGDLLTPIRERVDVLCANLPYLREDEMAYLTGERTSLAYEPRSAVVAGSDGLQLIRRAVGDLPRVLAPGGVALFECDPPQAAPIAELLAKSGLATRIVRDLAGADRVVVASS